MLRTLDRISKSVLLALFVAPLALAEQPRVGELPPPLQLSGAIQPAKGLDPELRDLRDRVVIVEFFGTWCGGCISALPHANEIVARFGEREFDYVFVSEEDPDSLREFVGKNEVGPALLVDDNGRTASGWGINRWPTAVVIGRDGRVAAITHPTELTDQVIEQLLDRQPIEVDAVALTTEPDLDWEATASVAAPADEILGQAVLRKSRATQSAVRVGDDGTIVADGASIENLLAIAGDARVYDVEHDVPDLDAGQTYRVSIRAPDGSPATARRQLRDLIETSFGATLSVEPMTSEFIVITRIPDAPEPTKSDYEGGGGGRWHEGTVKVRAATIEFLGRLVAMDHDMSFKRSLDESGLDGTYDFEFQYTEGDDASLNAALANYGLKFTKEPRTLNTVSLRRRTAEAR